MMKKYAGIRKVEMFVCVLIICLSVGFLGHTMHRVRRNQSEYKKLVAERDELQEEITALKTEVEELNDEDYVVRYARSHQIYTEEGEKAVKLPSNE